MIDVSEVVSAPDYSEKYYTSDIPRIDPVEKEIWCEALISDRFRDHQGQRMLKTPEGNYCCLGVYCEIKEIPQNLSGGSYRDAEGYLHFSNIPFFGSVPGETSSVVIPDSDGIPFIQPLEMSCISWSTFKGEETVFTCESQDTRTRYTWTLPGLNDDGDFTFIHIRDIINYFL